MRGRVLLGWAALLAALSSCYGPALSDGDFRCDGTGRCPEGFSCDSRRLCVQDPTSSPTPTKQSGCSDGSREGFIDTAAFPRIAACQGLWQIPGVPGPRYCTNGSGGARCSAEDLCAPDFHVCLSYMEVAAALENRGCAAADPAGNQLFITAESRRSEACRADNAGLGQLLGCGTAGKPLVEGAALCQPLNRLIQADRTTATGEELQRRLDNDERIGVLCCKS